MQFINLDFPQNPDTFKWRADDVEGDLDRDQDAGPEYEDDDEEGLVGLIYIF